MACQGRAILIPGRSFSGKSTLTAALLRAGATYLSDEYAVLDADGRVHPFAKPISMREDGGIVQSDHAIATFTALPAATDAVPVGAIVQAPYDVAATWAPEQLTPGAGAMMLAANAVGIRRYPARTLAAIRAAVRGVLVLDGPRGDADATASALLHRLREHDGVSIAAR